MANQDPIPSADSEFDTLQAILVAAVVLNAAGWDIPLTEIAKLTAKQTIWAAAWLIAKDKQNSTTAQKKAKDVARKNYEKVLRPFIQKWIYRNESMDDAAIEECGLKPRDPNHTAASKPDQAVVKVKRGAPLELIASCDSVPGAKYYGCLVTEGAPKPDWLTISPDGKAIVSFDHPAPPVPGPEMTGFIVDLNMQRIKSFTNLKHDVTYYFYYYVVNSAGVSILSEVVSIVCW